jgi:hypothetical protein
LPGIVKTFATIFDFGASCAKNFAGSRRPQDCDFERAGGDRIDPAQAHMKAGRSA